MLTPDQFRKKLYGPVVAMNTHFRDDYSVDLDAMRQMTEYYVEQGTPTVIVAGSTGEFFSLSDEERKQVIEAVVKTAKGRMTVIAGCAHSGTELTVELTKFAEGIGADGAMVTPPYYAYTGMDGMCKHYDLVTKATKIGIVIYFSGTSLQNPTCSGILKNYKQLGRIITACNGHASGFKDASGDFHFYRDISLEFGKQISIMGSSGMRYYLYGHLFGSKCTLTGLGNIWPKVEIEFFQALEDGNIQKATQMVTDIEAPYIEATVATGRYWSCLKAINEMVGLPGGPMRPPLLDCTEEHRKSLRAACEKAGLLKSSASPRKERAAVPAAV